MGARGVRGALVIGAAFLVLVLAACGSGRTDDRTDASGATLPMTTGEVTTTAEAPPSATRPPSRPLPLPEWRSAYALWLDDLRQALASAGLALSDFDGRRRVTDGNPDDQLRSVRLAIEGVGTCADLRTLLPPPRRVAAAVAMLRRSCGRFARGAGLAARALDERDDHLYARAAAEWRAAAALVASGNRLLPEPQPTEALPLQVQGGNTQASRVEPLLTSIANTDVPNEYAVVVRCWSPADWRRITRDELGRMDIAGYATLRVESANLAPSLCRALTGVAYTGRRPRGRAQLLVAFAAVTLMHEAAHILDEGSLYGSVGGRKEAAATCYGVQHIRTVALGLRVERSYADGLAKRYWEEAYPAMDALYRSRECRNGGKLDLRRRTNDWP